jgi:hypothetical protein
MKPMPVPTLNSESSSKHTAEKREGARKGAFSVLRQEMRTLIFSVALLVCATSSIATQASTSDAQASSSHAQSNSFKISSTPIQLEAPADVYFGVYRLSNLGVRNAIHDMSIEGASPLALPGQLERIGAVQSALADWGLQYPQDRWLPGTMLAFALFLTTKHVPQYDLVALSLLDELTTQYPNTVSGRRARERLANFVPMPAFDLGSESNAARLLWIFESLPVTIGENRQHHFL